MSDPWAKPPRRQLPEHLEDRILRELAKAPARRLRLRHLIAPLAAAALVAATVVGVASLGDRRLITPAETASPYPSTAQPTPAATTSPPREPTPTPTPAVLELDIRKMTEAEVKKDTRRCLTPDPDDPDPVPNSGKRVVRYATVQRRAGIDRVTPEQVRTLILEVGGNTWVCEGGRNMSWTAGAVNPAEPLTSKVPVAEIENYGGFSSSCGSSPRTTSEELFAVRDEVAVGKMRLLRDGKAGPWQVSRPSRGLIHLPLMVQGVDARSKSITAEIEFADVRGAAVRLQPYGPAGTKTSRRHEVEIRTCGYLPPFKPKIIKRPTTDSAGLKTCRSMAKHWAAGQGISFSGTWDAELLISAPDEWGAVLSDGSRRFGCSLFPTKEISAIVPDSTTLKKSAFYFAVNPIGSTGNESLWAAGRVPKDVTAISYRLPNGEDVAATLNPDGYWMIKHHTSGGKQLAEGNSLDWDPVVVTVTHPSGRERYTIEFKSNNMCNQVSHGC
jgi:hypothetical protein